MSTINVDELKRRKEAGEDLCVIDVRQPEEHEASRIEGSRLIPLDELDQRLSELRKDNEIIVHCKKGGRGAKAVEFLKSQGFENVKNLEGGNDAWQETYGS